MISQEFHSHEGKSRGWNVPCNPGDTSSEHSLHAFSHPDLTNRVWPSIVPISFTTILENSYSLYNLSQLQRYIKRRMLVWNKWEHKHHRRKIKRKWWYLAVDPCTCILVLITSRGVVRYALKPVHYKRIINQYPVKLISGLNHTRFRWV